MPLASIPGLNGADCAPGQIGQGWIDADNAFYRSGNRTRSDVGGKALLRNASESQARQVIRVKFTNSENGGGKLVALLDRYHLDNTFAKYFRIYYAGYGLLAIERTDLGTAAYVEGLQTPATGWIEWDTNGIGVNSDGSDDTTGNTGVARLIAADEVTVLGSVKYAGVNVYPTGSMGVGSDGVYDDFKRFDTSVEPQLTITGEAEDTVLVSGCVYPFTIGAVGTITQNTVITLSKTGVTGTFTPSTVTLTQQNPSAVVEFQPTSTGTLVLSATGTGVTTANKTISVLSARDRTVHIGDSITEAGGIVKFAQNFIRAASRTLKVYEIKNLGASGQTTTNWQTVANGGASGLLSKALNAIRRAGTNPVRVVIKLGTNDAKAPASTTAVQYQLNLENIVDECLAVRPDATFALCPPISPSATTNNPVWASNPGVSGYTMVPLYFQAIKNIIAKPKYANVTFGVPDDGGFRAASADASILGNDTSQFPGDGIHPTSTNAIEITGTPVALTLLSAMGLTPSTMPEGGTTPDPDPGTYPTVEEIADELIGREEMQRLFAAAITETGSTRTFNTATRITDRLPRPDGKVLVKQTDQGTDGKLTTTITVEDGD